MRNNCKYSVCSDNDSGLSMGKEFSSSFSSNHSTTQNSNRVPSFTQNISLKISLPDLRKDIKYDFSSGISVYEIQQNLLKKYGSRLVDAMNYGLFIPHQVNKAGKFLKEERWLSDYCSSTVVNHLEFIYKHRIVWPDKSQSDMNKKINSKVNHNRFIDYIIRNDPVKVRKALDKGLDPNFHCSSGETPLTITAKLSKPLEVITALIAGGAHLDYRAADSLTPLHKAAISGNYETVSALLNFGTSANCLDSNGMSPLYYNLLYDASTKCMEKLLHEHSSLGVVDKRGLKEIHQACRSGKSDHLDILLAYGADINCRTETHFSTPLHVAAYTGQEDCVRLLLVRGADRTLVNSSGRTAYQEARATGYKTISNLIKEFKNSEIHVDPSFKPVWNIHRKRSEFDITLSYLKMRNFESEFKEGSCNGGDSLSSSDRGRKKIPNKKVIVPPLLRERCSSQYAISKSTSSNIFSDTDDTSASSDKRSQLQSNNNKKRVIHNKTLWRHSSLLSLDNDSLSDSEYNSIYEVVLQKPINSGYGIDLDDRHLESLPSMHIIKSVEIGSPAFLAGLRSEDYLLEINGVNIRKAEIHIISKLFMKKPDTVVLKILRLNKYSDASTDPSLHYEKFAYQDCKPLRSFASADKSVIKARSNYNLSCLTGKYATCESSTTLNSISTILAPCNDNESKQKQFEKPRSTLRSKSPVNYNDMNLSNFDKYSTLGRKRSQSTDKQQMKKQPPSNKDNVHHLRNLRTPGLNYNTESLKPILKNTSASYGVRENIAIVKSRVHSSVDNEFEDIPIPPAQVLITRPIGTRYGVPVTARTDYHNKHLPQSASFDRSIQSARGSSLQNNPGLLKPILTTKEPSVREARKREPSDVKISTSEEDFCLPPPISFQ